MDNIALAARPRGYFLPLVAAGLVILGSIGWLAQEIPRGVLNNPDELLTAERTREMLLTTPWVVHFNFQPSFDKPPLQYWLTTLTLPRFQNSTMAVRIVPLFYGALTLIALCWLTFLVDPTRPWLIPFSVLLLAACPLFSVEARRALLDTGLTFFTLLAIICAQLARKKPIWWLGVAVCCWLGALQKIPLVLLVWLLIVLVRLFSPSERPTLKTPWLPFSLVLALILLALWPLLEIFCYGMPVSHGFRVVDIMQLFRPTPVTYRQYFEPPGHLGTARLIFGISMLLIASAIFFVRKKGSSPALGEMAAVGLTFLGIAILFSLRTPRYALPIVPLACLVLAVALYYLLEERLPIRVAGIILTLALLSGGFIGAKFVIDASFKNVYDEKLAAQALGELQRADVPTVLVKAHTVGNDLLYDSFYLFHGNLKFRTSKYTVGELREARLAPPLIGVCVAHDLPAVQEVYSNVKKSFTRAQFICWEVPAP